MTVFEKYRQVGEVETMSGAYPLLEIPQMSDERWQDLARGNAVRNYTLENGREPESVAQAVAWQRERVKMA